MAGAALTALGLSHEIAGDSSEVSLSSSQEISGSDNPTSFHHNGGSVRSGAGASFCLARRGGPEVLGLRCYLPVQTARRVARRGRRDRRVRAGGGRGGRRDGSLRTATEARLPNDGLVPLRPREPEGREHLIELGRLLVIVGIRGRNDVVDHLLSARRQFRDR